MRRDQQQPWGLQITAVAAGGNAAKTTVQTKPLRSIRKPGVRIALQGIRSTPLSHFYKVGKFSSLPRGHRQFASNPLLLFRTPGIRREMHCPQAETACIAEVHFSLLFRQNITLWWYLRHIKGTDSAFTSGACHEFVSILLCLFR